MKGHVVTPMGQAQRPSSHYYLASSPYIPGAIPGALVHWESSGIEDIRSVY
jgi:hypothetical protein